MGQDAANVHLVSQPRAVLARLPPLRDSVAGQRFSASCWSSPGWVPPVPWVVWPGGLQSGSDVSDTLSVLLSMFARDTEGVSGEDHGLLASPENVPLYIPYIFRAKPGGLTKIFSKIFF